MSRDCAFIRFPACWLCLFSFFDLCESSAHIFAPLRTPLRGASSTRRVWSAPVTKTGLELLNEDENKLPTAGDPYTRHWSNKVAVCAIMKDERAEDVKEFIEYHRYIGVDSFYIRENGDEIAIREELQPYIDAGILDLGTKPGPKHPTQTKWYNECSAQASKLHSWVAFIDLDEFIMVLRKNEAITEQGALKEVLRNSFRYTAAVSLQWVLFGSAGHKDMPKEGQMKGFNRCTGLLSKQMKCLGNSYWFHPYATFRPMHVHQCNFRFGAVAVLGNSEPLNMWRVYMSSNVKTSPSGASYAAHLSEREHKHLTDITDDYQLVLFHYVTRAQTPFIETKIHRRAGIYATYFAELRGNGTDDEDTLYRKFEHEFMFDGDHAICRQGAPVVDAALKARSEGWDPLRHPPGLLKY